MSKNPKDDAQFQQLSREYAKALRENDVPEGQDMSDRARAARDQMTARMRELEQED